jgi:hypothetical protein
MTAEIAIMNKSGVALAADSAVSIATSSGNTKVYNANKLFMLSKFQPIGVMVYGSADLVSVPWETIIKVYRQELGDTTFNTLREYGNNFISFLNNNASLFPNDDQNAYVYATSYIIFSRVKADIREQIRGAIQKGKPKVSSSDIEQITNETIKKDFDIIDTYPRLATVPAKFERNIFRKYYKIIEQAIDDIFNNHPLSILARKQLRRIGLLLYVKDLFDFKDTSGNKILPSSGLVIAGFGKVDLYPSLISYEMGGVADDALNYKESLERNIGPQLSATLIPFAQKEMVYGFMDGVSPEYKEVVLTSLKELFDKYPDELAKRFKHLTAKRRADLIKDLKNDGADLVTLFWDSLNKWVKKYNSDPIVDTIEVLPIAELASMAESLVNLTSFKRRVTLKVPETVGGPIDVAVISKGDGFVWISRKHYFEAASNPHFFKNYYR